MCVCVEREGQESIVRLYMSFSANDRPKREINCFFGAESLNNTLPPSNSKSNLSHRYFIASISRHIHQPVSTPLNSLSIPLDLHHHRAHRAPTTTVPFHHPDGTKHVRIFIDNFMKGSKRGAIFRTNPQFIFS